MPVGSVVLTPGSSYAVEGFTCIDLSASSIPDAEWTARVALGIASRAETAPLLLVLTGSSCRHAPHLGFAQRAARRAVAGYVLVDPVLPAVGTVSDWPDAPVTVIVTPGADADTRTAALGARLRGWEIREGEADSLIAQIASDS